MVTIRAARAEDAATIAAIRAQSWQAAYDGVIPAGILARATSPQNAARYSEVIRRERWRGMIVAEVGNLAVGFASFGPERGPDGQLGPVPGPDQELATAELYAIYAQPARWSTGAGRALMDAVLERVRAEGYASICLWVLEDNPRARRFYEHAGFSPTADREVLEDLGDVTELRYVRSLR
jgi:GNAT superfamily N-acetyltransferase